MYVRVVVNIPRDRDFTYNVPLPLQEQIAIGKMVYVPLGSRKAVGYIIGIESRCEVENLKDIIGVINELPFFDEEELVFYRWVSRYYHYPLGKTLFEIIPGKGKSTIPSRKKMVVLKESFPLRELRLTKRQELLMDYLREKGEVYVDQLHREFKNCGPVLSALKKKGILEVYEKEVLCFGEEYKEDRLIFPAVSLNEDQKSALEAILQGLKSHDFVPYLLHGVTGSGKTEVYLRAIEEVISEGGGVIFLVPEIGLTIRLLSLLRSRFPGSEIAIIHSDIARSLRQAKWQRIRAGEIKIACGARSALFVPMKNLRLIIVDEEHDSSYKQNERLRYNARDMAVVRAKLAGATVILGSATPSVQTYFNAMEGKYRYLYLPRRIDDRPLPEVEVIDMRGQCRQETGVALFSERLIQGIGKTLSQGNQVLLFLNRRGFHTLILCVTCGHVFSCANCDLALVYHASAKKLKCHYCDFVSPFPTICPVCHGNHIKSYGVGTERLTEETKRLFPEARVTRLDSDVVGKKGEMERILKALAERQIDILVGTQMIAKGHDYPFITLVGVICADISLNFPDFRAGERLFQLVTQVAGRGGRGEFPARVIIQTFNPEHYAIVMAKEHNYKGFFEEEINARRLFRFPPFTRLINVHLSSLNRGKGERGVLKIRELVRNLKPEGGRAKTLEVLGPVWAPIAKRRGRFRWQMLFKSEDLRPLYPLMGKVQREAARFGLEVKIDIDPMDFM